MGTKQVTCFIAVCDDCGTEYEHDYTPHWPSLAQAVDDVVSNADWWTNGTTLLCRECRYKPHAHVPADFNEDECGRCENPAEEHEIGDAR